MSSWLTEVLVGREQSGYQRPRWVLLALVAFTISFVGYAIDVFVIPGGVVWIPGDAALVGVCAAILVGYRHGGVLAAWLVAYASLLGYSAQRALFGYANSSLSEELAYFFDPESLAVLALEGLVLGVVAVAVGSLLRAVVDTVRRTTYSEPDR